MTISAQQEPRVFQLPGEALCWQVKINGKRDTQGEQIHAENKQNEEKKFEKHTIFYELQFIKLKIQKNGIFYNLQQFHTVLRS